MTALACAALVIIAGCARANAPSPDGLRKTADFLPEAADFAVTLAFGNLRGSELEPLIRGRLRRAGGFAATLRAADVDPLRDLHRIVVCGGFGETAGWLVLVEHQVRPRAVRPLVDSFLGGTPVVRRVNGSEVRTAAANGAVLVTGGLLAISDSRWLDSVVRTARGDAVRSDPVDPIRSVVAGRFDLVSVAAVRIPPRLWSRVVDAIGVALPGPPAALAAHANADDGLAVTVRLRYGNGAEARAAADAIARFSRSEQGRTTVGLFGLSEAFASARVGVSGSHVLVDVHLTRQALGELLRRLLPPPPDPVSRSFEALEDPRTSTERLR